MSRSLSLQVELAKGVLAALDRLGKDKPAGALVADLAAGKTAP